MDSETRTVQMTEAEIAAARAFFDYGATRGNHEDEGRGPYPGPLSPHVDAMGTLVRKALAAAPHAAPREGEPEPELVRKPSHESNLLHAHYEASIAFSSRPTSATSRRLREAGDAILAKFASQQAALDAAGEALRDVQLAASLADNEIAHGDYQGDALRDIRRARQFLAGIDRLAARASHPEARDGE